MNALSQWGRPWTAEEDQQIREMTKGGIKDADIAAALGRSTMATSSRRRRLKVSKQRDHSWSKADIKALHDESLPNLVVAHMTGRHISTINRWRRTLGIKSAYLRRWTDEEEATMLRLYPTGGCYAVNKATGWSHKAIMNKAQVLKITRRSL